MTALGDLSLREFANQLASTNPSPGGGAAGSFVVVLAAGCARKAVVISLRKRPESGELLEQAKILDEIIHKACLAADDDAAAFSNLMAAYRLPKDLEPESRTNAIKRSALVAAEVGERIDAFARGVLEAIEKARPYINANILNDLEAARAMAIAARAVQKDNIESNRKIAL
jgi:methenyltetrahydrofolate cyclohydrolase